MMKHINNGIWNQDIRIRKQELRKSDGGIGGGIRTQRKIRIDIDLKSISIKINKDKEIEEKIN